MDVDTIPADAAAPSTDLTCAATATGDEPPWEHAIAELLRELSTTQDELLAVLGEKRRLLAAGDVAGLSAMQPREARVIERLRDCHGRRERLLERAASEGKSADSVRALARTLPAEEREKMGKEVNLAAARARLLQTHSLTNWVLAQRTLLHLAQMLEIIATGGRQQPTYGKSGPSFASGSLVDRAV